MNNNGWLVAEKREECDVYESLFKACKKGDSFSEEKRNKGGIKKELC